VTTLAKKYGIVTPFTAYLILEDDRRRDVVVNRRLLPGMDRDEGARRALDANFRALKEDKSGAGAVAAARAQQSLAQAKSSTSSLKRSNAEAVRGVGKPGALGGAAANRYFAHGGAAVQQNIRFVSGKSFYQNASCWIDSEVQNQKAGVKKVRIKFGSSAYFKLLRDKPAALKWISLGKHVEFVLEGTHYEIYEDKKNEKN